MRIYYDNQRRMYRAVSDYAEKDTLKAAGFFWNPAWKNWETTHYTVAEKVIQYCDKTAIEAIQIEKGSHYERFLESQKASSDFDAPHPKGLAYFPFQRAGIEFIVKRKDVLLADEMGLGKTIQAIGAMNVQKQSTVVIVCPAIMKLTWKLELKKWLVNEYDIQILSGRTDRLRQVSGNKIIIVNYDIVKAHYQQLNALPSIDLIVVDESHSIKNWKAQRSQYTVKLCWKAKQRLLMTGTPVMNRPSEIFNQLKALNHYLAKDYHKFAETYLEVDGWGTITGTRNLEDLQERLRTSCMLRRVKSQVLTELPPKFRQVITLASNILTASELQEQREALAQYQQIVDKIALEKEISSSSTALSDVESEIKALNYQRMESIGKIAKVRHETAVKKIPYIVEHVKEILEQEDKVVVFVHHHDVVDALMTEFKGIAVRITGQDSNEEKQKSVERFQTQIEVKVAVVSIKAAGVGITLNKASVAVFGELDWTPSAIFQAEDRLHRIGQKSQVSIQYLVIDGSIDAWLANMIVEKQTVIEQTVEAKTVTTTNMLDHNDYSIAGTQISERATPQDIIAKSSITEASDKQKILVREACSAALRRLANNDPDRAGLLNGIGFNGVDTGIGHSLADQTFPLTEKQVALAKKILFKYRGQIPAEIYNVIFYNKMPETESVTSGNSSPNQKVVDTKDITPPVTGVTSPPAGFIRGDFVSSKALSVCTNCGRGATWEADTGELNCDECKTDYENPFNLARLSDLKSRNGVPVTWKRLEGAKPVFFGSK